MVTVGSILSGTFRFVRNNVPAILVWSGVIFLLSLATMALMQPTHSPQAIGVTATEGGSRAVLSMLVMLLVSVVLWAGALRGVLSPEKGGPGYLRLGMDELRLLACALILILAFYLILALGGVVIGLVLGLLGTATGVESLSIVHIMIFGMVASAIVLGPLLGTRFSLAGPLTLLDRKVIIGPSWRLTRGNFWRLLGAYLVIVLIVAILYIITSFFGTGPSLTDMLSPTDQAAEASLARSQEAALVLSFKSISMKAIASLIGGFGMALEAGVIGVAAQQLLNKGDNRDLGEVFE